MCVSRVQEPHEGLQDELDRMIDGVQEKSQNVPDRAVGFQGRLRRQVFPSSIDHLIQDVQQSYCVVGSVNEVTGQKSRSYRS